MTCFSSGESATPETVATFGSASWKIPDPNRAVPTRGQAGIAVGRNGDTLDAIRVSVQTSNFLPGVDIPNPYGLVPTSRQERLAIPRHCRTENALGVAIESAQFRAGSRIPKPE